MKNTHRSYRLIIVVFVAPIFCSSMYAIEHILNYKKDYIDNGMLRSVAFTSPEGPNSTKLFTRKGQLVVHKDAPATVLIAHGYMCSMQDVAFLRWMFGKYNSFVFDFRAHGDKTDEQVCTFGHDEAYDVIAAVKFLRSQPETRNKPIIAYGFSMGAASIIEAQAQEPELFIARILDCPFDSSEALIKRGLANMKFRIFGWEFPLPGRAALQKYAFHPYVQPMLKLILKTVAQMDATPINTTICPISPVESIKKSEVPSFFIHCKNDEKIPVEAAKAIYNNAVGYKRLWLTNGRRHFDSYFNNPEKYAHKINRFIESVLNGDIEYKQSAKITEDAPFDAHDSSEINEQG